MGDLYFSRADATPEAWATVERVASEWIGDDGPWGPFPLVGWTAGEVPAIPLHLPAGRDLAERVLADARGEPLPDARMRLLEEGFTSGAGGTYADHLARELTAWGGRHG